MLFLSSLILEAFAAFKRLYQLQFKVNNAWCNTSFSFISRVKIRALKRTATIKHPFLQLLSRREYRNLILGLSPHFNSELDLLHWRVAKSKPQKGLFSSRRSVTFLPKHFPSRPRLFIVGGNQKRQLACLLMLFCSATRYRSTIFPCLGFRIVATDRPFFRTKNHLVKRLFIQLITDTWDIWLDILVWILFRNITKGFDLIFRQASKKE